MWWTRTQSIRTVVEAPFEKALVDVATAPEYQRIAAKALHLLRLGFSRSAIARRLGVTIKTVAKTLAWLGDGAH